NHLRRPGVGGGSLRVGRNACKLTPRRGAWFIFGTRRAMALGSRRSGPGYPVRLDAHPDLPARTAGTGFSHPRAFREGLRKCVLIMCAIVRQCVQRVPSAPPLPPESGVFVRAETVL